MQEINIIAAMGANGGIGLNGVLPDWHLTGDLQRFAHITHGKVVIMGRHTFNSLPVLLRNRLNIVLTRRKGVVTAVRDADGDKYQRYLVSPPYPDFKDVIGYQWCIERPEWLLAASHNLQSPILGSLRRIICDADRLWNAPFVIGGAEVFRQALPTAALMFLTVVSRDVEADVFFPKLLRDTWYVIASDVLDSTRAEPATNYILIHKTLRYTKLDKRQHWGLAEAVLPPSLFEKGRVKSWMISN